MMLFPCSYFCVHLYTYIHIHEGIHIGTQIHTQHIFTYITHTHSIYVYIHKKRIADRSLMSNDCVHSL